MTNRSNKQIVICGKPVKINQFIEDFDKYFPIIKSSFHNKTLDKQNEMTPIDFKVLLFDRLYKKPEYSISVLDNVNPDDEMLTNLGFNVIIHKSNSSRIIFKESNNVYNIKTSDLNNIIESLKKELKYNKEDLNIGFGVELEFIADRNCKRSFNNAMKALLNDKYEDLDRYNHNSGNKWVLGRDMSVRSRMRGYSGFELTSRILHYNEEDLNELKQVITLIKNIFNGEVNKTCGTHIHMSFKCDQLITEHFCKHFARSYARNEKNLFDRLVPLSRREDQCRWCRHTSVIYYNRSRYQKLNFNNVNLYNNDNELHLEFRQLDGTLDYERILAWIKLQRLFMMTAYKSYNKEHTELKDCIHDVINMSVEDVICSHEFTNNEIESLMKSSKLIS
jgi:hypothetical protein